MLVIPDEQQTFVFVLHGEGVDDEEVGKDKDGFGVLLAGVFDCGAEEGEGEVVVGDGVEHEFAVVVFGFSEAVLVEGCAGEDGVHEEFVGLG